MIEEVQCEDCGWQGHPAELWCSDEDFSSNKAGVEFNLCPNCESDNITEVE